MLAWESPEKTAMNGYDGQRLSWTAAGMDYRNARRLEPAHGFERLERDDDRDMRRSAERTAQSRNVTGVIADRLARCRSGEGGRSPRRRGAPECQPDDLGVGRQLQDADLASGGGHREVNRQLTLREEMADRAIVGLNVRDLAGFANVVGIMARRERRPVAPSRQAMQAWSAEHHCRVNRDERGDQELAGEPRHHDEPLK